MTFGINMAKLKKAYAWCKRNIRWILAAIGVVIAVVVAIIMRADKKQIEKLLIESKVLKVQRDISYLEGKKAVLAEKEGNVDAEIAKIDTRIAELDAALKAKNGAIDKMSMEDRLAEFKRLGY
jgi:uncharacterized membrane protein YgaE (UPF0421/DUF939 family)